MSTVISPLTQRKRPNESHVRSPLANSVASWLVLIDANTPDSSPQPSSNTKARRLRTVVFSRHTSGIGINVSIKSTKAFQLGENMLKLICTAGSQQYVVDCREGSQRTAIFSHCRKVKMIVIMAKTLVMLINPCRKSRIFRD